jgi:hypothetical protein
MREGPHKNEKDKYQFIVMIHDDKRVLLPHVLEQVCNARR